LPTVACAEYAPITDITVITEVISPNWIVEYPRTSCA
jgi:hypothetical protein